MASAADFKTSAGSPILPQTGVAIAPGLTAFTRIPRLSSSAEATLASERKAALLALSKLLPPNPIPLKYDVVIITEALEFKKGIAFCRVK